MPLDKSIKKVLVIGSGPIVIGQAAEFDYAGTQACRVLRESGVKIVLVNSNPATIMTDKSMADFIYLEPLTLTTVKRIIEKERPDSLLAGLGGQTGLTLAMQLHEEGFLQKHGIRLLGTKIDAIKRAEDRQLFKDTMAKISQPLIPSDTVNDLSGALAAAERIGYPVIVRPAYTLGGAGGGVAYSPEELKTVASVGLDMSPITQVLIEKYIIGWKEIEFEVMRDRTGKVASVCSMENVDPVGIHTGDSIVVAPAMTLNDYDYGMLRKAALDIITELGIEGGCNCQFALNPNSSEYAVIEVNPRVSRSSALASKATGYPIAKVTAKIALGYTLDEITDGISGEKNVCFEPEVNYIVVKFPKWPFEKFPNASRRLGTQMKATGEVMAIAQSFEMALMKAVRGAESGADTLNRAPISQASVRDRLDDMDDVRIFTVFEAIKEGISADEIYEITKIDHWFLNKLKNLAEFEKRIDGRQLSEGEYAEGKKFGYTDAALRRISGGDLPCRQEAVYKIVDTCAAAFKAKSPYFYSSYDGKCDARAFPRSGKETIIVLGSGPIRIGQGIEFDYSSVHCVVALKELGYDVVIINNNPETVSTDYDTADRLYFEPLTPEDVMNVVRAENPAGVVVAFGGQTAIRLAKFLDSSGIKILGTSADGIDLAEDRDRFDSLLEKFSIRRPRGMGVMNVGEAFKAADNIGYPVLLRPSYVIGGQNMTIAHTPDEVEEYMDVILKGEIENPVLIDKYMPGLELEVDVISDGEEVLIPGIMEHIERAGIHSGDSIAVYPPHNLNDKMLQTVISGSRQLALALGTKGLVNIQYLIFDGELYVIEVNPRASRTVPYISKVTNVPMISLATRVMLGEKLRDLGYGTGLYKTPPYVAVKVPVFSFEKLSDANSILGPEMKSTGEVLGIGKTTAEALFKGLSAAGFRIGALSQKSGAGALISVADHDMHEIVSLAKKLYDLGIRLYATADTSKAIASLGTEVEEVPGISESREIFSLMENGKINFIVYTGALFDSTMGDYIMLHKRAVQLAIPCLTSLDTAAALADIIASRYNERNTELVDINNMREKRRELRFHKMEGTANDYIYISNFDGEITCPESLALSLCHRHCGIGGDGLVLIEHSAFADAKMRIYNRDGYEAQMAGNSIRCVAKYLFDNGIVNKETMNVETSSGEKTLTLYITGGKVSSVGVSMGKASLKSAEVPVKLPGETAVDIPVSLGGTQYRITCVSMGNPHCVVFLDNIESLDLEKIGPEFENADIFPERVNTEFVRAVNGTTLKMRVWERGNGETMACGTGACAAVVAAVENGLCRKGEDITVKVRGGDLIVNYTDEGVTLTGGARLVFQGTCEY